MLNFLVPRFLKNLDKHLLLNNPLIWISKLHYVFYFTLILWIITALVAFLIPLSLTDLVETGLYYTFFTIIAVIFLSVWIYKNAIFNIERNYRNRNIADEYKIFFIYFLCVFLFFSFSYPFTYIYNYRIAHAVSDEELVSDLNTLNLADAFFVRNYYDYAEIQAKQDSVNGYPNYTYEYDINQYRTWGKFTPYQLTYDSASLPGLMTQTRLMHRFESIRGNDAACLQAINGYISVMKKYELNFNYFPKTILSRYRELCKTRMTNNYNQNYFYDYSNSDFFYRMESIMRNIVNAKFEVLFILKDEFNIPMFYFIFYTCVFFMMFRNVNWQQFLITVVTMIVLPILIFIFGQFMRSFLRDERFFQDTVLLIYLYCLGTTIYFAVAGKKFSGFISICMQLPNVLTPVIFLRAVEILRNQPALFHYYNYDYYNDVEKAAYYNGDGQYSSMMDQYYRDYYYNQYKWWMWASTIFGVVFYVLAFMPFMKEQFMKRKAMPKNR